MGLVLTVYGLKNCDTCRKALKWLESEGIAHRFHDVRADGIGAADVKRFAKAVGWETLLNKASTTWRSLPDSDKHEVTETSAVKLMASHPALIKRPVFDMGSAGIAIGFRDTQKAQLKKAARK
ncbi:arsenate reductase [Parvibaculum sp.]|jgi:arsenate reductase (glutaredoxin)|uniref:arsenate reductase n=1 Tax=Parvibaculum sp. TaxID=2024848 RepID=UPI0025E55556|nr:arsenate reductase [Parvibaculum sp.]